MRRSNYLLGVTLAVAVMGCGGGDGGGDLPDAGPDAQTGFSQPAGTVPVNFVVDDSQNKVYQAGDLQWKGSMTYDEATRKITHDSTWTGPWATLYDDGPWTAGGHEPVGSTAGDNKWGITVFATPPATGSETYEYGLIDTVYETMYGNGWIWVGSNGTFTTTAGSTAAVTAQGMTFAKFGTTDLQLSLDLNNLGAGTFDDTAVRIKGSAWAWSARDVTINADNVATFTLSEVVGAGKPFSHSGLLKSGDKPEFVWVLGQGDGVEYKNPDTGEAHTTGVTAGVKAMGDAAFTDVPVEVNPTNKNTFVTVP